MEKKCGMSRFAVAIVLAAAMSVTYACQQDKPVSSEVRSLTSMDSAVAAENTTASAMSGQELYTANCAVCHSMRPPAKTAPPIVGLATRFRTVYGNKSDAVDAMVSFMKNPDAGKSALGPQAIKRFGLMPAMAMSDGDLEKVSGWLWDQYDPDFDTGGGGNCR